MDSWLQAASDFVWGPTFLIPLLVGTGIFLSIVLRGLQFRQLGERAGRGCISGRAVRLSGAFGDAEELPLHLLPGVLPVGHGRREPSRAYKRRDTELI